MTRATGGGLPRVHHSYDLKRSHIPRCQLLRVSLGGKVLGREPDPLTDYVCRSRPPAAVRPELRLLGGAYQSRTYLSPDPLAPLDVGSHRRDRRLLLLVLEQRRLVAERGHERRDRCGCRHQGVMGRPRQPRTPCCGVPRRHAGCSPGSDSFVPPVSLTRDDAPK